MYVLSRSGNFPLIFAIAKALTEETSSHRTSHRKLFLKGRLRHALRRRSPSVSVTKRHESHHAIKRPKGVQTEKGCLITAAPRRALPPAKGRLWNRTARKRPPRPWRWLPLRSDINAVRYRRGRLEPPPTSCRRPRRGGGERKTAGDHRHQSQRSDHCRKQDQEGGRRRMTVNIPAYEQAGARRDIEHDLHDARTLLSEVSRKKKERHLVQQKIKVEHCREKGCPQTQAYAKASTGKSKKNKLTLLAIIERGMGHPHRPGHIPFSRFEPKSSGAHLLARRIRSA